MNNNEQQSIVMEFAHFIVYHLFVLSLFCITKPLAHLSDLTSPKGDTKFMED